MTGKGQEMSRGGKGTGLAGHDCTPWSTDRLANQAAAEEVRMINGSGVYKRSVSLKLFSQAEKEIS